MELALLGVFVLAVVGLVIGVPLVCLYRSATTEPFVPDPGRRWERRAMTVAVGAACLGMLYSLTRIWFVSYDMSNPGLMDGGSGLPRFVVVMALATGAAVVRAVYGGRRWAALPLLLVWVGLAVPWSQVALYMPMGAGDLKPIVHPGLRIATWATAALTGLALSAVILRPRRGPAGHRPR